VALPTSSTGRRERGHGTTVGIVVSIAVLCGAFGLALVGSRSSHGLPLYAYGTSYLASDIVNTPGKRYIEQFQQALQPSEFHNFAKDGATIEDVATSIDSTWHSQRAIVVVDALTNSMFQTRTATDLGIEASEPVFRSMINRLGRVATILVVKQGYPSESDYELFDHSVSNATVDAWNAMVDRATAGVPNVRVIETNQGWDPSTMMEKLHPTDAGEDHIARQLVAEDGLPDAFELNP
jgi:hypothetical protein